MKILLFLFSASGGGHPSLASLTSTRITQSLPSLLYSIFLFYKNTSHTGLGTTLTTSPNFIVATKTVNKVTFTSTWDLPAHVLQAYQTNATYDINLLDILLSGILQNQ